MGRIETALRETFLPTLFREEEVDENLWKILGRIINNRGLGIPEPHQPEERCNITSKARCEELLASILGVTNLNCVGHMKYIYRGNDSTWKKIE